MTPPASPSPEPPTASLQLRRAPGKLRNLEALIADDPLAGTFGIGHTRWATHGRPTEENAHPHRDCTGTLVVVHNGIVENYLALKQELIAKGHKFVSETDTEIIAHLIEQELSRRSARRVPHPRRSIVTGGVQKPPIPLEEAVRRAVKRLTGAFAIGVLSAHEPNKLVAARFGPPAVLGLGDGEYFLASDVPGILHHTRNIHFLADGELAILTPSGITLTDFDGAPLPLKIQRIAWDPIQAEKAGYKHFMLKEIYEQPRAIRDTILGRVSPDTGHVFLPDMSITEDDLRAATQITIAACGTSLARRPRRQVHDRAPRPPPLRRRLRLRVPLPRSHRRPRAIGLLITQSGETADTLAAQRELIAAGSKTLAICNVVGAAVSREAQGTITTNAGPEIGVASTKAFTAQLTALFLLALKLGQVRGTVSDAESLHLVEELGKIPAKLDAMLNLNIPGSHRRRRRHRRPHAHHPSAHPAVHRHGSDRRIHPRLSLTAQCEELAKIFSTANDFLFLGRGIHYPIALEGALKLKEISYIHAEGYPAGEMKHGPNALIDETLPVVCIATQDPTDPTSVLKYEKTLSNIQEVTARSGRVIAIAIEGDQTIAQLVEHVIYIPAVPRTTPPHPRSSPPPTPRLPHSRPPRLRRRPTQKPRQERHRGVKGRVFHRDPWRWGVGTATVNLALNESVRRDGS